MLFGLVDIGLCTENTFCFSTLMGRGRVRFGCIGEKDLTYAEMLSNSISTPSASFAAVASSSPATSMGPDGTALEIYRRTYKFQLTSKRDQLASMHIVKTVFAFAG